MADRYEDNLKNLIAECKVECTIDSITDTPIVKVIAPDGHYCNFKLTDGLPGTPGYHEAVYQLYDTETDDGQDAVFTFSKLDSSRVVIENGGVMLLHLGDMQIVLEQTQGGVIGGTLGTVVAHELHKEYKGIKSDWLRIILGEGKMIYEDVDDANNKVIITFNETDGVYEAWINLKNIGDLQDQLFPEVDNPPPDCGCSTPGSQNTKAPTGALALSMLAAAGILTYRKREDDDEIVEDDEVDTA